MIAFGILFFRTVGLDDFLVCRMATFTAGRGCPTTTDRRRWATHPTRC